MMGIFNIFFLFSAFLIVTIGIVSIRSYSVLTSYLRENDPEKYEELFPTFDSVRSYCYFSYFSFLWKNYVPKNNSLKFYRIRRNGRIFAALYIFIWVAFIFLFICKFFH